MSTDFCSLPHLTQRFLDRYGSEFRARAPQVSRAELALFFKLFVEEVLSNRPGHFYGVFEDACGAGFTLLLSEITRCRGVLR